MFVLVLGHRRGLAKALSKFEVPFGIWNTKDIHNAKASLFSIQQDFPLSKNIFLNSIPKEYLDKISHVLAGSEESVVHANKIRSWLGLPTKCHRTLLLSVDKGHSKLFWSKKSVTQTKFYVPPHGSELCFQTLSSKLGVPFLAKLRRSSGGRGQIKIHQESDLSACNSEDYLFEEIYTGYEGSIESFVKDGKILFTNHTQYEVLGKENHIPGSFSQTDAIHEKKIKETLALNAYVIEQLSIKDGMTHLEFIYSENGLLFGEVACRPPGGYLMEALELSYNYNFWEFLVNCELGLPHEDFPQEPSHHCASLIFHPGKGTVHKVSDLSELRLAIPQIKKIRVKVQSGDLVEKRKGVGNDVGHALIQASSKEELKQTIQQFKSLFSIEMS